MLDLSYDITLDANYPAFMDRFTHTHALYLFVQWHKHFTIDELKLIIAGTENEFKTKHAVIIAAHDLTNPAKGAHDSTRDIAASFRFGADAGTISFKAADAGMTRLVARSMEEIEELIDAQMLVCGDSSPWDAEGLLPLFDGKHYNHVRLRMFLFAGLKTILRMIADRQYGVGPAKRASHPRRIAIQAAITRFTLGQLKIAFAHRDLHLLSRDGGHQFMHYYTAELTNSRSADDQAGLLRSSMLYLAYQCPVCGRFGSANVFCLGAICQFMYTTGTKVISLDPKSADLASLVEADPYKRYSNAEQKVVHNDRAVGK